MSALSVEDAQARILSHVTPTEPEHVELAKANNRVLASDLKATLTQPPFDASAMDGYAVRCTDVAKLPATLKVIGESAAGHAFDGRVGAKQAVRIFTGAPVPDGSDAIVIQENTTRDGVAVTVLEGTPDPGHIRHRALDFSEGDIRLLKGSRLSARTLTLAAAMGHGKVPVYRKPRVAIIATGDELVLPGTPPDAAQIVCSNPFGLAAMVEAAGGEGRFIGIAKDNEAGLRAAIRSADDADVIVTIGGASVGDHDLVAPVLKSEGMVLDFWKIAMRPGKPLLFGRMGGKRVLGLPGNPTSSLICARVFLIPLVLKLLGETKPASMSEQTARLTMSLPANGPRAHYMRGVVQASRTNELTVTALPNQDSSMLTPLAEANCLIARPPFAQKSDAGDHAVILKLDF